jgi:hypothetical protein
MPDAMRAENKLKMTTQSEKHLPNTYQDWLRRLERLQQIGSGMGKRKFPHGCWPVVEGLPPPGLSTGKVQEWLEAHPPPPAPPSARSSSLAASGFRSLGSLHDTRPLPLSQKELSILRHSIKVYGRVPMDSPEALRLERHFIKIAETSTTFRNMVFHDEKFAQKVMVGARELLNERAVRKSQAQSQARSQVRDPDAMSGA